MKMWYSPLRFILICFLNCLSLFTSYGQQPEQKEPRKGEFIGGIRAGFGGAQMFGDNYGGFNKLVVNVGPLVSTKLKSNLELQLELNYSNKGSRDPAKPDKGKFDSYRISAHYVDLPIMFKFWVWKFKFEAGLVNNVYIGHNEANQFGKVKDNERLALFSRYSLEGAVGILYPINDKWSGNARLQNSLMPATQNWYTWIPNYGLAGGLMHNHFTFGLIRHLAPR